MTTSLPWGLIAAMTNWFTLARTAASDEDGRQPTARHATADTRPRHPENRSPRDEQGWENPTVSYLAELIIVVRREDDEDILTALAFELTGDRFGRPDDDNTGRVGALRRIPDDSYRGFKAPTSCVWAGVLNYANPTAILEHLAIQHRGPTPARYKSSSATKTTPGSAVTWRGDGCSMSNARSAVWSERWIAVLVLVQ
jgi:hypothetical protein